MKKIILLILGYFLFPSFITAQEQGLEVFPITTESFFFPSIDEIDSEYYSITTKHSLVRENAEILHLVFTQIDTQATIQIGNLINYLYYARSLDNGRNWDIDKIAYNESEFPYGTSFYSSALEIDSQNRLHIIFNVKLLVSIPISDSTDIEELYEDVYYAHLIPTDNPYLTDLTPMRKDEEDFSFNILPNLTIDEHDNIYITWVNAFSHEVMDIKCKRRSNDGTWSESPNDFFITNTFGMSVCPSVGIDRWGKIHIVWMDNFDGNFDIYYKQGRYIEELNEISWGDDDPQNISKTTTISVFPSLAVDRFGNIHTTWFEGTTNNLSSDVFYQQMDPYGNWLEQAENLTNTFHECVYPSLSISNGSDVYLAFISDAHGNPNAYYWRYVNGIGWDCEIGTVNMSDYYNEPIGVSMLSTRSKANSSFDAMWLETTYDDSVVITYLDTIGFWEEEVFIDTIDIIFYPSNLIFATLSYDDSPNPPTNFKMSIADSIYDLDDNLTIDYEDLEGIVWSWNYSDPEGRAQILYQIQIATDSTFADIFVDTEPIHLDDDEAIPSGAISEMRMDTTSQAGWFYWELMDRLEHNNIEDDGIYYVRARCADHIVEWGGLPPTPAWSGWSNTFIYRYDTQPPELELFQINDGATITWDTEVKLTIDVTDSINFEIFIWEEEGNNINVIASDTINEYIFDLQEIDDEHIIFLQFIDAKGHELEEPAIAIITLDLSHIVTPDEEAVITLPDTSSVLDGIPDNDTHIYFPEGAVDETLYVYLGKLEFEDIPAIGNNTEITSSSSSPAAAYEITLESEALPDQHLTNIRFNRPVYLALHYLDEDQDGYEDEYNLDEKKLAVFSYDGVQWNSIDSWTDENRNIIEFETDHFPTHIYWEDVRTVFAIFEKNQSKEDFHFIGVSTPLFTPNGDGQNDLVEFAWNPSWERVNIKIYDLLGVPVREFKDAYSGTAWYGKDDNGADLEGGIYIYQIEINDRISSEPRLKESGTIVIVR